MIGLLSTVAGMIGAFNVLRVRHGENQQAMAGNIGSALWTTAAGLVVAIPVIAYFLYKTKFSNIVAAVNQVAGEMVFTLVERHRYLTVKEKRNKSMLKRKWAKRFLPEMPPPAQ